jgi:hypothetical protein
MRSASNSKGVIVLHSGGGGTSSFGTSNYAPNYYNNGYSVIQLQWASAWEDTGVSTKSILTAGCRPSTVFQHFSAAQPSGTAFCGHGHSGGSGAMGYAMAWYGGKNLFDKVLFSSGPVFGDISIGCQVPFAPDVLMCPTGQTGCNGQASYDDPPLYAGGAGGGGMGTWTGDANCAGTTTTTQAENAAWKAMSVTAGGADFVWTQTATSFWLCYEPTNNSPAQGQTVVNAVLATGTVPPHFLEALVTSCASNEQIWMGTYMGQDGLTASVNDMIDPVKGCVRRH